MTPRSLVWRPTVPSFWSTALRRTSPARRSNGAAPVGPPPRFNTRWKSAEPSERSVTASMALPHRQPERCRSGLFGYHLMAFILNSYKHIYDYINSAIPVDVAAAVPPDE